MPKLYLILLSNNSIERFAPTKTYFPSLRYIIMSNNNEMTIQVDMNQMFPTLRYIDIRGSTLNLTELLFDLDTQITSMILDASYCGGFSNEYFTAELASRLVEGTANNEMCCTIQSKTMYNGG